MALEVRSRIGNAVLGLLGIIYFFAAVGLLAYDLIETWGAAGLLERAVQFLLLICALTGAFFVFIASRNLGLRFRRREPPHRREGAAVVL